MDAGMWTHNEIHLLGDLLEELAPDIVGLSTRSVYDNAIDDILFQMKRVSGAITIAGGHDASFRPQRYVGHVDFACIGEGEETLLELGSALDRGKEVKQIPNLAYSENGELKTNYLRLPRDGKDTFFSALMDRVDHFVIDQNQSCKTDFLLRENNLNDTVSEYYTMLGRGCTGRCTFCSVGRFHRLYENTGLRIRARRPRAIESVVSEISFAKEMGFKKIYFLDPFFLAPKPYLLSFFNAYRRAGGLPFFAQLRPEQVLAHPEILDEAINAGLDETAIGIQSGSERINRQTFNRKTSHEKLLAFADMLAERGNLKTEYHFITHNPFESEEDHTETISLIGKLPKKNTQMVLRPFIPWTHTRIEQMMERDNPPVLDRDEQYRLMTLYLMRYAFPDTVFEQIRDKFRQMSMDDLQQAYAENKKVYKTDNDLVFIGLVLLNRKEFPEALAAFDSAVLQNPKHYGALKGKGWAHLGMGSYTKAEACFRKAIEVFPPGEVGIWRILGELSIRSRKIQEAADCYQNAKHLASPYYKTEYRQIILKLGWAYNELGDIRKTRDLYTEALTYIDASEKEQVENMITRIDRKLVNQGIRPEFISGQTQMDSLQVSAGYVGV